MRVTVPVVMIPPTTELGEIVTACSTADAPMPKPQLTVLLPRVAYIDTVSLFATPDVVIEKGAESCPACT